MPILLIVLSFFVISIILTTLDSCKEYSYEQYMKSKKSMLKNSLNFMQLDTISCFMKNRFPNGFWYVGITEPISADIKLELECGLWLVMKQLPNTKKVNTVKAEKIAKEFIKKEVWF